MVTASCDLHSPCTKRTNQHQVLRYYLWDQEKDTIHRAAEVTMRAGRQHGWKTRSPLKVQVRVKILRMTRKSFTDTEFKLH